MVGELLFTSHLDIPAGVTVHGFWGSFGGFWSEICIMR